LQGQRIGWIVGCGFAIIVPWLRYHSSTHWHFWAYEASECFFYGVAYFFNVLTAAHFNLLRNMFQRRLVEEVEFNTRQARQHLTSLEFNAAHDTATGLLNRVGAVEALRSAAIAGEIPPLAIACLRFHRVNELACVFGMDKVDQALAELAALLQQRLPAVRWVARIRHDELALALGAAEDRSQLLAQLNAVDQLDRDGLLAEFSLQDEFTCGVVIGESHAGSPPDERLRQAEQALLFAIAHQVRCQVHDQALTDHFLAYNRRYEKLRVAIAAEALTLHYQPQIDLRSGQVVGVEALARWQDADEGMVPPDVFIPIIESTGLLPRFSRWTIRQALKDVVAWQAVWPGVTVSINLSADALHDDEVLAFIGEALAASGADPRWVIIELTESVMLRTPEVAVANMQRLVDLGLRLSIDDYGVGFSSLTYVKQLPAHELKVDRLFVSGLPQNPLDRAIVDSTIELAHNLGLKVVAEGIEDQATQAMLEASGCDIGQGWHIARAMPFESFLRWTR
ncbi:MAG: bifunctional diguanylate cyclase/phosphodiesterase, partial [Azonexus sp.]|nr:bifunctional diguanylate cyclase/phosphodiesterase [Azonexus sp.]